MIGLKLGFTLTALLALVSTASAALVLVDNGRSRAAIVVENSANAFHMTAADDLQKHIELVSGAKLPIIEKSASGNADNKMVRLIVGAGSLSQELGVATADLKSEAYRIQTKENSIVFVGHDIAGASNATSWAVGCFLDRYLGVRWLWPGELGTYAPHAKTISIPRIDLTGQPAFEKRQLRSRRDQPATTAWLRHHQMGSRMKFQFGHAFTQWWPKYHESHPDYFAVPPPGEKQPYPAIDRVKLRIGNPAVADQIIENWRQAGRPDNWNVCPNDGSGWDTSDESRALDLPDVFSPEDIWRNKANLARRFIRFWNGLLVRMRKENPQVTLSTYAYSCYREPPNDVKLEPGMVVGIVHSYAGTEGWQKWNEAGAKLILRPNWWHLGGSAPHIPLRAQGEYFRYARAHSMIGFDFDRLRGEWGTQGALYYLVARLSVRPDLSIDHVMDEYAGAFGSAAPMVRDYLDYWERYTAKIASPVLAGGEVSQNPDGLYETLARKHGITTTVAAGSWSLLPFLYTDEVIAPAESLLARAQTAAARDDAVVRKRISYLQASLALFKEHREVIRLADKKRRRAGETNEDLIRQMGVFETLRKKVTDDYGPIGFDETIPSLLNIQDPRKLEGL